VEISKTKSVIFSIFLTLLFLFVIEMGVRAYFYLTTSNSYYLFYGFVIDESEHDNQKEGYFKFFPNKDLRQGTTSHTIPTRINSHGFRGQDFSIDRDERRRIVTMGGSSTFGYYSRDEFTYPSIMQSYLNESDNTTERYEVINVGIPHMQTKHIVKMLEAEVLSFKPDVITLYSGCNDTWSLYGLFEAQTRQQAGRVISLVNAIKSRLLRRSLAFKKANDLYINSDVSSFRFKQKEVDDGLNKVVTYLYESHKIDKADFEKFSKTVRDQYLSNLQQIVNLSREHSIKLLFVKQKYTLNKLRTRAGADPLPYASASGYYEEVAMAEKRLEQQGWLWLEEASLLTHVMLMDAMAKVAEENGIRMVDGISALDGNPEYLKSYVHLSEEGNAVLARVIAEGVSELLSGEQAL